MRRSGPSHGSQPTRRPSPLTTTATAFAPARRTRAALGKHDLLATLRPTDKALRSVAGVVKTLPMVVVGTRTLAVPLDIDIASDVSGSLSSTDPSGESGRAVLAICDWLAAQSGNPDDRISLTRFASTAETTPAVPARKARKVIRQALTHGRDVGGGTNLTAAVDSMCATLTRPEARVVVVLITDGQVTESDTDVALLAGRLHERGDAVYLVALDTDGSWSTFTHRRYEGLMFAGVIPVNTITAGTLASVIAKTLAREAGLQLHVGATT